MPKLGADVDIYNLDLVMVAEKLDRMALEVQESASSGLNEFQSFDKNRVAHFITDIRQFVTYANGQPEVDYAHSHPTPRTIKPPKARDDFELENEAANLLRAEILRCRENVLQSQSSVRASGFMNHDLVRIMSMIDRLESLLNQYIDQILPVDRPETFSRSIPNN